MFVKFIKIKIISLCLIFLLLGTSFLCQATNQTIITNKNGSKTANANIIDMVQQIDENLVYYYLSNLVEYGIRYTGSLECQISGDYLYNEFEKMGLFVEFHDWSFDEFNSRNVVATLNGSDTESDAIFLITAHYDTFKNSPGANDDGSGVAAVLAIANVCSKYSFNHTIRFICFSGEEVGTYGSLSYARDSYEDEDNIIAVLNLDIIGYANSVYGGKIIRFHHEKRSSWIAEFAQDVSNKYLEIVDMTVEDMPNYRGHDGQAFLDYGYDGVWLAEHDGYSWGHSPNDTIEHINLTYLSKATKFMLAVLVELANRPIDLQVIIKTPYEGTIYFLKRKIPVSFARYYFSKLRGTTIIFGKTTASVQVKSSQEIKFVVFCKDNNFVYWDSSPPYEWDFNSRYSSINGMFTLRVYAYTYTGQFASDEMDIIMFSKP
ncbi:MAG: hypothetical protein BV456_04425 [Thermoplasmata archaeon M8B2D]|nr:MAG: hypothetical protein BV456_04425 [Thermoplasmata archaeon M8B2D]